MSEQNEEVKQEILNIRHFAQRMLEGIRANDGSSQSNTLFDLAKLIGVRNNIEPFHVFHFLIGIWNGETAALRMRSVAWPETKQTVYRIIGEVFGKYGLPDDGYEEDDL